MKKKRRRGEEAFFGLTVHVAIVGLEFDKDLGHEFLGTFLDVDKASMTLLGRQVKMVVFETTDHEGS